MNMCMSMLFIDLSVSRAHSVLFESYDLSD